MTTAKTITIEILAEERRLEDGTLDPDRLIVMKDDLPDAINKANLRIRSRAANGESFIREISNKYPAGFWKDFTRNVESACLNWPSTLTGYGAKSAKDVTGGSFRFIPIKAGERPIADPPIPRTADFNDKIVMDTHDVDKTLRQLVRTDESGIVAVLAKLEVLDQHFNKHLFFESDVELLFIQASVKIQPGEVDALWSAKVKRDGIEEVWLVCCEVKTGSDDILEEQLVDTTNSVLRATWYKDASIAGIIPMAIKRLRNGGLFIIEYEAVPLSDPLKLVCSVSEQNRTVVEFNPPLGTNKAHH